MAGSGGAPEAFSIDMGSYTLSQPYQGKISNHFEGDGGFTVALEYGLTGLGNNISGTRLSGYRTYNAVGEEIRNWAMESRDTPPLKQGDIFEYSQPARCPVTGLLWQRMNSSYDNQQMMVAIDDVLGRIVFLSRIVGTSVSVQWIGTAVVDQATNRYRTAFGGRRTYGGQSEHVTLNVDYNYVPGSVPSSFTQLTYPNICDHQHGRGSPYAMNGQHYSSQSKISRVVGGKYFNRLPPLGDSISTVAREELLGLSDGNVAWRTITSQADGPIDTGYPWVVFEANYTNGYKPSQLNNNATARGTFYAAWESEEIKGSPTYCITSTILDSRGANLTALWKSGYLRSFYDDASKKLFIIGEPGGDLSSKYNPSGSSGNAGVNLFAMQIDVSKSTHTVDFAHLVVAPNGSEAQNSVYAQTFGWNPIAGQYCFNYQIDNDLIVMPAKGLSSDINFLINGRKDKRKVMDIGYGFKSTYEPNFPGWEIASGEVTTKEQMQLSSERPEFYGIIHPETGMRDECEPSDTITEWA